MSELEKSTMKNWSKGNLVAKYFYHFFDYLLFVFMIFEASLLTTTSD